MCVGFDRDLKRTMHFCISAGRTLLHLDPHRHPKAKGLFNRDNSQLTVKPLACLILATARMCSKLRAYQIVKREGGQLQIGQIGPLPFMHYVKPRWKKIRFKRAPRLPKRNSFCDFRRPSGVRASIRALCASTQRCGRSDGREGRGSLPRHGQ